MLIVLADNIAERPEVRMAAIGYSFPILNYN